MDYVALACLIARMGTYDRHRRSRRGKSIGEVNMNGLIYLVGLVVVIMFILSVLGLR
jgi:hypothetical protein